jgi:hypothetical protein
VLVEAVFGWPGLGHLVVSASLNRNYPLVPGLFLCISAMTLVMNLLTFPTDPRQLFANKHVHHPGGAEHCVHHDGARTLSRRDSDDCGIRPGAVPKHGEQIRLRLLRGDESDQDSLIGEIKRLKPENFAEALRLGPHRQRRLVQQQANAGRDRHLVQDGRDLAACRIPQCPRRGCRGKQCRDQGMEWFAVTPDVGLQLDLATRCQDRSKSWRSNAIPTAPATASNRRPQDEASGAFVPDRIMLVIETTGLGASRSCSAVPVKPDTNASQPMEATKWASVFRKGSRIARAPPGMATASSDPTRPNPR